MKATLRIVVAACLLLLITCGSSPQSLILGRWDTCAEASAPSQWSTISSRTAERSLNLELHPMGVGTKNGDTI
jgi:hypothetical protein